MTIAPNNTLNVKLLSRPMLMLVTQFLSALAHPDPV